MMRKTREISMIMGSWSQSIKVAGLVQEWGRHG